LGTLYYEHGISPSTARIAIVPDEPMSVALDFWMGYGPLHDETLTAMPLVWVLDSQLFEVKSLPSLSSRPLD